MTECLINECSKSAYIRGLCRHHYKQDLLEKAPKCSVDDCSNPSYTKGWCEMHYGRMRSHGSMNKPKWKPRVIPGNRNKGAAHNRHKHGLTGTPTYKAWSGMKRRCYCEKDPNFKHWGGRGIKVCARWLDSFDNFLEDMGLCPSGMTIDRENNDGDYEPGNCRWADRTTQSRNRRFSRVTPEIVEQIRADRRDGKKLQWLSFKYKIGLSHVHRIVNYESWK